MIERSALTVSQIEAIRSYIANVSALAGYLKGRDDQWYAFSILMNSVPGGANGRAKQPLHPDIESTLRRLGVVARESWPDLPPSEPGSPRVRIAMSIVFSVMIVVLYGASLKASFDYVSFMKVEKSSYLKIRLDWLDSIYVIFLVAIIVRYLWLLAQLVRGKDPQPADLTKVSSGL